MKSKLSSIVQASMINCGLLTLAACGPALVEDVDYIEHRRNGSAPVFQSSELNSIDGAIELVQESPAPDDAEFDGTTLAWIDQLRQEIDHTVMFPNWEGQRKGAHQFTVRYVHIEIDFDYNMEHVGFEWHVDTMLKQVDGPVALVTEELKTDSREIPTLNGLDVIPETLDL